MTWDCLQEYYKTQPVRGVREFFLCMSRASGRYLLGRLCLSCTVVYLKCSTVNLRRKSSPSLALTCTCSRDQLPLLVGHVRVSTASPLISIHCFGCCTGCRRTASTYETLGQRLVVPDQNCILRIDSANHTSVHVCHKVIGLCFDHTSGDEIKDETYVELAYGRQ